MVLNEKVGLKLEKEKSVDNNCVHKSVLSRGGK